MQFIGVPCAFLFGALAAKVGAKPAILGALVRLHRDQRARLLHDDGARLHGARRAGRPGAGRQPGAQPIAVRQLIPKDRIAEFFGFFAVFEKFAGIFGPLLFSAAVALTGSSRAAILSVIVFFVAGGALLVTVDIDEGRRAAER